MIEIIRAYKDGKEDLEVKALQIILKANGPILMVGHDHPTNDPTQTANVKSTCSNCGCNIYSTELKEKIRELESTAQVLCYICLESIMKDTKHD